MTRFFFALFWSFLLSAPVTAVSFQTGGDEDNPFVLSFDEGPIALRAGGAGALTFTLDIPPNHYLYAESIEVRLTPESRVIAGELKKPAGTQREDPFFGKTVPVYFERVSVDLAVTPAGDAAGGEVTLKGEVQFQGCSDQLCYRVMHVPFEIAAAIKGIAEPAGRDAGKIGFFDRVKAVAGNGNASILLEGGFLVALLIAFLGGVATDFTPCVWPIIPITLAVIGVRKERGIWRNLWTVSILILGMAVAYSLLGVASALLGKGLGFLFQSLFFLVFLVIVLVAMALSLFGLYELRLPSSLHTKISKTKPAGHKGIFFIGLTIGIVASPCVGPIVGPLLAYVAQTKSVISGSLLLFSYALGMGTLFLLLGLFYGELTKLVRSGAWMDWLKKGLGVLMLVVAVYYSHVIYKTFSNERAPALGAPWDATSLPEGLERGRREGKPVVVDFYAIWCPPCMELDRDVWTTPAIAGRLDLRWIAVKIDCTKETADCREAVDLYGVVGWPTVVFVDRSGLERKDKRLVGKVIGPEEMDKILDEVERGSP